MDMGLFSILISIDPRVNLLSLFLCIKFLLESDISFLGFLDALVFK